MYSNLFISKSEPLKELVVDYYHLVGEISPNDFYRIIKGAEKHLYNLGFCVSTFKDKLVFLDEMTKRPPPEFSIGSYKFKLAKDKMKLTSDKHAYLFSNLVFCSLKFRAYKNGYIGPESQKFFRKRPFKVDYLAYHDAFEYDVVVFNDGRVGIWLDPTTRWKQSVQNFLTWSKKQELSQDEIKEALIGKIVKCPSPGKKDYRAKIVDVCYKSISEYNIKANGIETTVYDYWISVSPKHKNWLDKKSIQLDPNEKPVITVQMIGLDFRPSFPSSLLNLVIDINDPLIPRTALSQKKILKPRIRINETKKLFDLIIKDGLLLGKYKLDFNHELIDWTKKGKEYARVKPLPSPDIQFGNEQIIKSDSPFQEIDRKIASALREYGPVSQIEKLCINYIVPSDIQDKIESFHETLNNVSKEFKLADLTLGEVKAIDRLHPDRYLRESKQLMNSNDLTVVILPETQTTKAYISAKRGLGEKLISSQMLEFSTFSKIVSNPQSMSYTLSNIVAQIYDKSLDPGESIWHLAKPAGRLDPKKVIYFMGFDVSRAPEKRKEAAAYAAVCDPYGRMLYRKAIDTHKGEKIQAKVLSDWFFDVASSTFDESKETKKIDCLILFKDGPIQSNQVIDYKNGALDAKNRLVKEGIMEENCDIKVVSVIKKGPHRIYGKERFDYSTQNTSVIWNEKKALIVTAKAHQGTSAAIRINLDFQINEDMIIDQVIQIFNDLRYLDWSSLYKQPKTILPLHIVQNLAKLSAHDINVPYIPR